jgi:hypothetical protein
MFDFGKLWKIRNALGLAFDELHRLQAETPTDDAGQLRLMATEARIRALVARFKAVTSGTSTQTELILKLEEEVRQIEALMEQEEIQLRTQPLQDTDDTHDTSGTQDAP